MAQKGTYKVSQLVKVELLLPGGALCLSGEVVSVEPYGDREKVGVRFSVRESDKKPLRNYAMARQREILNKIREVAG